MITNPVKAIRAKCLDCNVTAHEVELCPCTDCALYPFHFGKNPYRKPMSEEQRKIASERMKAMKETGKIR